MPEVSDSSFEKSEKNRIQFSSFDKAKDKESEAQKQLRIKHQTPERLLDRQTRLNNERDTGEFILVESEDAKRIFMSSNSGALNSYGKDRFYPKYLNFDTNNTIESKGDEETTQTKLQKYLNSSNKNEKRKNEFLGDYYSKNKNRTNKMKDIDWGDDDDNDYSSEDDSYKIMTIENKQTPSSKKKKIETAEKEKLRNEAFLRYSQNSSLYFQQLKEELQRDDDEFNSEASSEENHINEKTKKPNFSKKPFSENLENYPMNNQKRVSLMKSQVIEGENENRISQNINLQRQVNQKSSMCQENKKSLLVDSNLASTNPFNSQIKYENDQSENQPNLLNTSKFIGYETTNPYIESSPQFCQLPDSQIFENSKNKNFKKSGKKQDPLINFGSEIRVSQPPFRDNHQQEITQHREMLNSNFDMINKKINKISQFQTPPPKIYGPPPPLQTNEDEDEESGKKDGNLKNYLIKVDTEINSINGKIESILSFLQESSTKKMVNKSSQKKISEHFPRPKPSYTPTLKTQTKTRASPRTQNTKISSRKRTVSRMKKKRNSSARILWSREKDSPRKKIPATVNISLCDIMNASSGSATKKMSNKGLKTDQEKLEYFRNFNSNKVGQISAKAINKGYITPQTQYIDQGGSDEYLLFEKPKPKKSEKIRKKSNSRSQSRRKSYNKHYIDKIYEDAIYQSKKRQQEREEAIRVKEEQETKMCTFKPKKTKKLKKLEAFEHPKSFSKREELLKNVPTLQVPNRRGGHKRVQSQQLQHPEIEPPLKQ